MLAKRWMAALAAAAAFALVVEAHSEAPLPAGTFARIGPTSLSADDFRAAYAAAARGRFYHSKPPEAEVARFQREVGDDLVNRVLVVDEAKRRGIAPDAAFVQAELARYETRSRHAPRWAEQREPALASMREQLENQSRYEQLERRIRDVARPTEREARSYYDTHRPQFVEPEQLRVAVILLKVDPGAPKAAWDKARSEAEQLQRRLGKGAEFAALARAHSGDESASKGGDMGYLHKGMLPSGIAAIVEPMKLGETSAPVTLLEGVAILRLVDRKPERARSFDEVRGRAAELARRAEAQARWQRFVGDLRRATEVRINEAVYLPLAAADAGTR